MLAFRGGAHGASDLIPLIQQLQDAVHPNEARGSGDQNGCLICHGVSLKATEKKEKFEK